MEDKERKMYMEFLNFRLHVNTGKKRHSFALTPTSYSISNFLNEIKWMPFNLKQKSKWTEQEVTLTRGEVKWNPKIQKNPPLIYMALYLW